MEAALYAMSTDYGLKPGTSKLHHFTNPKPNFYHSLISNPYPYH